MIKSDFLSSNRNLTGIGKLSNIYHNVILDTQTSIVYDENFNLIEECLYEVLYWGANIPGKWFKVMPGHVLNCSETLNEEIDKRKSVILNELEEQRKRDDFKVVHLENRRYFFALHPTGWYPYGHLHDSLNRLFTWKELDKTESDRLLVSQINKVNDFDLHCAAYGFSSNSILECRKLSRFIRIPTLYYGVNPSFYTSFTPECYSWVRSGYSKVFNNGSNEESPCKLYLDRNHVKGGARGVRNNDEVKDFLKGKGFKIVTGSESLSEIYTLFSNAELIVGVHGSLFVNTIFANDTCKIIEYCPANRPDFSFQNKYKNAIDYTHFLVDADSDFNIDIDLDELSKLL